MSGSTLNPPTIKAFLPWHFPPDTKQITTLSALITIELDVTFSPKSTKSGGGHVSSPHQL
jgi:hypothetical protein